MMRFMLAILLVMLSVQVQAQESKFHGLQLATPEINRSDMASIKRGAKFVATNCLSCHTLVYLRYDKVAQEAGVTYEKMPVNVKTWPYGVTPPDLSLEADVRGLSWIYTYLHSFYIDAKRPTGANNLLVPDTAMPNIVLPFQGEQVMVKGKPERTELLHHMQWYDLLKQTKQGSMTPEEFDTTIGDVVNFLGYAAEPYRIQQHKIGFSVLAFLFVFFFLIYALKREYWKDVKRHKNKE
ncbi:MAG: cytochrome c1 [Gammaproteobacteria bacterium]